MPAETEYLEPDDSPSREDVEGMSGPVLLEFGTEWCGICRALAPRVAEVLAAHPEIRHVKVEDGPGRSLGRSFGVRLWPNLVFLRDGVVVRQLARPGHREVAEAAEAVLAGGRGPA